MSIFYGTGTHRLIYKAQNFTTGLTVTAYIWNPSLTKSALQTFTEVSDGMYYLDYNFAVAGTHFGKFYEGGTGMIAGTFRVEADLTTIKAVVDSILADTGTDGVKVSSLSASAVDLILDEIVEGTLTMRQLLRILLAKNTGLTEGSGTATIKFRDLADSKYRITGTITDGNRVSVTLDGS